MRRARAVRLLPLVVAVLLPALPVLARPALDTSTLTLTSSAANPPHGALVTFTATVSGGGACAPAAGESIAFTVDGAPAASGQTTAAGQATYASSALTPGQHTIGASYAGDANCTPATASLQQQIGSSGATLTALAATTTVSANSATVLLNAIVSGLAAPCSAPTGNVSFSETTGGAAQLLGSAPLGAPLANAALLLYTGFAPGVHTVVATYPGDINCAPSSSAATSVTVLGPAPAGGSSTQPIYGGPITILTGVGGLGVQAMFPGCTAVSLSSLAGTPVAQIAALFTPNGGVTGIWRYNYATRGYLAGYLANPAAPLDFSVTGGGQETYSICTSGGGTIRSSG